MSVFNHIGPKAKKKAVRRKPAPAVHYGPSKVYTKPVNRPSSSREQAPARRVGHGVGRTIARQVKKHPYKGPVPAKKKVVKTPNRVTAFDPLAEAPLTKLYRANRSKSDRQWDAGHRAVTVKDLLAAGASPREASHIATQVGLRNTRAQVERDLNAQKRKHFKIAGVDVEGAANAYQRNVNKGADVLKRSVDAHAGKRAQTEGGFGKVFNDIGGKVTKDLIDTVAQAPSSFYDLGAAGVEAAQGRPSRANDLIKQYREHDPIVLTVSGKPGKAWKEVKKHPGLAGLEGLGAAGTVSRVAGSLGRTGALGKTARSATSIDRAPKTVPGVKVQVVRKYPKGVVGKAGIKYAPRVAVAGFKGGERAQVKTAKKLYGQARQARKAGDLQAAAKLRTRAQKANPSRATGRDLKKRYDRHEGLAEPRRRLHRGRVVEAVNKVMPAKHEGVALLLAQHIVKPSRESLAAYLEHIKAQKVTTKSEKISRRELTGQIQKALDDPKLDLAALHKSGRDYAKVVNPLQKQLVHEGVLSPESARMAKLVPLAVREMGAKWNPKLDRLELNGEKLPVSRIERYVKSTGRNPDDIPFVSQHPANTTANAMYQAHQDASSPGIRSDKRTGVATDKGTFAVSRQVAKDNAARMQGVVDKTREFARFIDEFAKREGKRVKTFPSAAEATKYRRERLSSGGQHEWVPVAIRPMFGGTGQVHKLLNDANSDVPRAHHEAVTAALSGMEGAPRYALVPKSVADQMAQHMKVLDPTPGGRAMRSVTSQFKNVVLPTSTKWIVGNQVEAALRSLVNRAGPGSYRLGRQVLSEMHKVDPKAAEELVIRIGEGHYGMQELQSIRTSLKSFDDSAFQKPAQVAAAVRAAPGAKQVIGGLGKAKDTIFAANGKLEHQYKVAMLGRHVKDTVRVSDKDLGRVRTAAAQFADGKKGTNEQFAAAEAINRAYGRYDSFSPSGRRAKAQYLPFVAWAANATRFLVDVLPREHPTVVALVAANQRATEPWQKKTGLAGAPGYMKGTIPTKTGNIPLGRFTPFSIGADPLGTVSGQVLPQAMGTIMNLKGLDWKGNPLGGAKKASLVPDSVRLKAAGGSVAGALLPIGPVQRGTGGLNPLRKYKSQDPRVSEAFKRLDVVQGKLNKLPTLQNAHGAQWQQRRKLLDEQKVLKARVSKYSKGKYFKNAKTGGSTSSGGGDWRGGSAPAASGDWRTGG